MRPIKIRGLVIEPLVSGEKWITSDEEYHEVYLNYAERSAYINGHAVVWESVSEYTGLKDKNGREIYERDIVNTIYNGELFTGIVIYDKSELGFKATNGKENYGSHFQYLPCCEKVEIIGNIDESPELLKN